MSNILQEDRYIMSDIVANNNKFWNIIRYGDHSVTTQWGRVGEDGQSKTFPHSSQYDAERFYGSKCREKEKKGYVKQKTLANTSNHKVESLHHHNLAEVAKKQIQTNSPLVLKLVDYLSKVNVHNILNSTTFAYDESKGTFSTPLGIVTQDAIQQARNLLTQIGGYVVKRDYDNPSFFTTTNSYLMMIPQDIGRRKPDLKVLYPDLKAVQQQNGILDALEASLQVVLSGTKTGETKQDAPKLFNAKLEHIEDGKEIDRIRKKYKSTLQTMHGCAHLDVKKVYSIEIEAMSKNFEKTGKSLGAIWELWHGSRVSNILSILKGGLLIPPSSSPHVTGRMFSDGLYFAPASTKSLNYSYGYWDGKNKDNNCYMFLADVAMGKFFVPKNYYGTYPVAGYDSTWAKAGISGVSNDECIVYKTNQASLKFLIEFSPGGK